MYQYHTKSGLISDLKCFLLKNKTNPLSFNTQTTLEPALQLAKIRAGLDKFEQEWTSGRGIEMK